MAEAKPGGRRGSQSQKKDDKDDSHDKCVLCSKVVSGKDLGVQCEICETWFHAKCVDINSEVYAFMEMNKNIHWYCDRCNKSVAHVLEDVSKLKVRQDIVDSKLMDMSKEMEELKKDKVEIERQLETLIAAKLSAAVEETVEKRVVNFRDVMEQQLREEMKGDIGDTLRKEFMTPMNDEFADVNKKLDESKVRLDKILSDNAEQEDIEARKNNIILYRVEESNQTLASERYKEDVEFCEKFLHALEAGIMNEDITKVFRLGKRNLEGTPTLPRPILIKLGSRHAKNLIMESLYKIQSLDGNFQQVSVSHDMTQKQRTECKAMVAEAVRKSASGDFLYKVRGAPGQWRFVQMRKTK